MSTLKEQSPIAWFATSVNIARESGTYVVMTVTEAQKLLSAVRELLRIVEDDGK